MALLLAGTTFFESSFLPHLLPTGPKPDLVLILVLSWSLLRGTREGILWGGIGGLFLGLVSGFPWGSHILLLTLLAALLSLSQPSIYRSNPLFPLAMILLASLFYNSILILLRGLTSPVFLSLPILGTAFLSIALPQTLWNTALSFLLYPLLRLLHLATAPARLGW